MSAREELPSELRAELSSRILKEMPQLRVLFRRERIDPIDGQEFERLIQAVWLAGYGAGATDVIGASTFNQLPEIMRIAVASGLTS